LTRRHAISAYTVPREREPLTAEEATRLQNNCRVFGERLVVWTLLDTGLRVGEFAALLPAAIDWQGRKARIDGKAGPFGKKKKRRLVPLTARAVELLGAHFATHETMGMSTRTIQRIIRRVASRARIVRPTSPHVLRHTFAVLASERGISLPAIQRVLGHDHLETTAIYLNLSMEEAIREFREKWGRG